MLLEVEDMKRRRKILRVNNKKLNKLFFKKFDQKFIRMDKLPNEMIKYIISFIDFMPKYLCKKTLHKAIDNNIELSKVNSLFNKSLSDKRQDFKRLYELVCKYGYERFLSFTNIFRIIIIPSI